MQEAELMEHVEHLFTYAFVQTYQRDALIALHHALRRIWQNLVQPSEGHGYHERLETALLHFRNASLQCRQGKQLVEADLAAIEEIERQFDQLEDQVDFR